MFNYLELQQILIKCGSFFCHLVIQGVSVHLWWQRYKKMLRKWKERLFMLVMNNASENASFGKVEITFSSLLGFQSCFSHSGVKGKLGESNIHLLACIILLFCFLGVFSRILMEMSNVSVMQMKDRTNKRDGYQMHEKFLLLFTVKQSCLSWQCSSFKDRPYYGEIFIITQLCVVPNN